MNKFFYNRATKGICTKKPFILIECRILITHKKKVNKRPYCLVKNTPHFILWFEREHLIQLIDNCEWKAQNLWGKWRKSKSKWTQVSLKNVVKVKDPKLSRVLIVQNNVCAALHGAIGEDNICLRRFFAGFFHISKRRKTAMQLNRTETLKPGKKNAHVILFTHGRA